jgi:predicted esterase
MVLATLCAWGLQARADETGFPCEGCVVIGDPGGEPRPLLVVLHGDEGGPSRLVGTWRPTVQKAKVTLFAPKCPAKEGCVGSWWQWDGSPSFILDQVAKVEAKYRVDPTKRYLGGWSGGSTYITFHLDAWFPTFAAVSIAGGGAPGRPGCFAKAGGACAPIHYMMGDRNPLFDLAVHARDVARACGHDVTWQLVSGADHEAEWRAYVSHTSELLEWLLARSDGCTVAALPFPSTSSSAIVPPATSNDPAAMSATPPVKSSATNDPPIPTRVAPRCTCEIESPYPFGGAGFLVLAALGCVRRARLRRRRDRSES